MRIRQLTSTRSVKSWPGFEPNGITPIGTVHPCSGPSFNVATGSFSGYTIPMESTVEYMEDDPKGGRKSKPVHHRKFLRTVNGEEGTVSYVNGSPTGVIEWFDARIDPYWTYIHDVLLSSLPAWSTSSKVEMPPRWVTSGSNDFIEQRLYNEVREKALQLKADWLLNIVEASQFLPAVKSLATFLPVMARKWTDWRKLGRREPFQAQRILDKYQGLAAMIPRMSKQKAQDVISDAYLSWKFGLAPVISDIRATVNYASRLQDELKRAMKKGSERFSAKAELQVSFDNTPVHRLPFAGFECADTEYVGRPVLVPTVRYVLVVEREMLYSSDILNGLDSVVQRFVSTPANFFWERMPFSFVADWFVDIRGLLNRIDDSIGATPFKIKSCTRSYTYHLVTDVRNVYRTPCGGTDISNRLCGSASYKSYTREVVSDPGLLLYPKIRFGKTQAALSAALIAQQLRKLRAKR